jgi:hypothetical protein
MASLPGRALGGGLGSLAQGCKRPVLVDPRRPVKGEKHGGIPFPDQRPLRAVLRSDSPMVKPSLSA